MPWTRLNVFLQVVTVITYQLNDLICFISEKRFALGIYKNFCHNIACSIIEIFYSGSLLNGTMVVLTVNTSLCLADDCFTNLNDVVSYLGAAYASRVGFISRYI